MRFIQLLVSIHYILSVLGQDEYGCADDCECPNLIDYANVPDYMDYAEEAGCVCKILCPTSYYMGAQARWNESEIPQPSDAGELFHAVTTHDGQNEPVGPIIDMYSFFGFVCENGTWFMTKYPLGVGYHAGSEMPIIGTSGEFNGKKTIVKLIYCKGNF